VEHGQLDYVVGGPPVERVADLRRRYGLNRNRLWDPIRPQTFYLAFNTRRPLFRGNASLRRAIAFALDRPAIVRAVGDPAVGRPTDQLLPPSMPGFADRHLYPLDGPSLPTARRLARGHLRGAHAVLYVSSSPTALARGAAVQRELARIGLQVDIRSWAVDLFPLRLAAPNEPYDMTIISFAQSWPDPGAFLGPILDSRMIPAGLFNPLNWNFSRFKDTSVDARLRSASRLTRGARDDAYARLESDVLARQAPVASIYYLRDLIFVSSHIGCVTYNPVFTLDYAKLCRR
jgi:ABC-type oligopeptide transport system substrate-binding subunit